MAKVIKTCPICGKEFKVSKSAIKYGRGKYCSVACQHESYRKQTEKKCLICGKSFKVSNWNKDKKYCSHECQHLSLVKEKITKTCLVCGNTFKVKPCRKDAKVCSSECRTKFLENRSKGNVIIINDNYAELVVISKKHGIVKALIDKEDIDKVFKYTWSLIKTATSKFYLHTERKDKKVRLHRYIMNCPDDMEVDHINHNTLDNRKENLRICTPTENKQNLPIFKNKTGVTYLYQHDKKGFTVRIQRNNVYYNKYFLTAEKALTERNKFLKNNYKKLNLMKSTLHIMLKQNLSPI